LISGARITMRRKFLIPLFNKELSENASECSQTQRSATLLKQVHDFLFLDFPIGIDSKRKF